MLLIILLNLWLQPCEKLGIEEEVKNRDIIAIGRIDEEFDAGGNDPNYTFYILDYFKGYGNIRLEAYAPNFEFENDTYYLIFAKGDGKGSCYIEKCSYTQELNKIESNTLNYLYEEIGLIPCYDSVLKQEMEEGACERNFSPVCGCDGRTYGTACLALKNGITKFTDGKCK